MFNRTEGHLLAGSHPTVQVWGGSATSPQGVALGKNSEFQAERKEDFTIKNEEIGLNHQKLAYQDT